MICRLCTDKPDANLDVDLIMKSLISNDADYVIPECIQGITETTKGPVTEQSFIVVIGQVNTQYPLPSPDAIIISSPPLHNTFIFIYFYR